MKKHALIPLLFLVFSQINSAQNPIISDIGMSDPHVRVFNDKLYLYTGNDEDPDDRIWVMRNWRVFSSTDLTGWTQESTISPADNYMGGNSKDCWAADAATRNGKYYFYFSDRDRSVGVMTSNSPTGPFSDPLGKPLARPRHDPTILTDDDANKTRYMVYGNKEDSYHIVKLNDDMISLAETPRRIKINGKEWDNAPIWMDKNYIFKHNGVYYLSWGRDYATSTNVYGPYTSRGRVGTGYNLSEFAHGSFFWWKGQFYHIWCYYLRPEFRYRESIMTYCHFDDDGNIVTDTDFLDKHYANGVGQYDSSWSKIEAEWFYEKSGELKKQECVEGGFQMSFIKNGDWLRFNNTTFSNKPTKFSVRVSSTNNNGKVELRKGSPTGELITELAVPNTGGFESYETISAKIEPLEGKQNIYLVFKGGASGFLFNINWMSFSKSLGGALHITKRNAPSFAIDGNRQDNNRDNVNLRVSDTLNSNQLWEEIDRGNGFYSYKNKNSNRCLDAGDGGANGQNTFVAQCQDNNQNQQWKRINVEDNYFRLQKRNASNFALDGGNGGANGQEVYLWTDNGSNLNQQWQFYYLKEEPTLGVDAAVTLENKIQVYPNPVEDYVTINNLNKGDAIIIYDLLGSIIYKSEALSNGDNKVSTRELSKGVYLLSINKTFSFKLLKK